MKSIYLKKLITATCLSTIFSVAALDQAKATLPQVFWTQAWTNPASMSTVEKFSASIGGRYLGGTLKFKGTNGGVTGTSKSDIKILAPNGQIMYRIHPSWVIGLDISTIGAAYENFKSGNLAGTKSTINIVDYSPKISYEITDKLALGIGIDLAQTYNYNINFPTPAGEMRNKAKGFGVGWNTGFLYKIQPTSLFYGSYHSKITHSAKNKSSLPGAPTTHGRMTNLLPNTWQLEFVQIFSKNWLVGLKGRYEQWDIFKNLVITDSAFGNDIVVPIRYKNTWDATIYTRYQFACQWAGLIAGAFYSNPYKHKVNRGVGLPIDSEWAYRAAIQYMPTKQTVIEVAYVGGVSNPKFNNPTTIGKMKIVLNAVDVKLTYKF